MTINSTILFLPMLGQSSLSHFWTSYSEFCLSVLVTLLSFLVTFLGSLIPVLSLLLGFSTILGVVFLIHFCFSLPLRRVERARLFLDLLENALNRGQTIEQMILSLAQSRDRTVGVRFHLVAAHIEGGLRFIDALEKVPRFLPPQISAMFRAGEKLGDLRRVLPACREILQDRPAAVRSAMHYMILVILFFSPVFVGVVTLTTTFVVPRFQGVAEGSNARLWPVTLFVFHHTAWLIYFEVILFLFLFVMTCLYIAGPRFARCLQFRQWPLVDWIAWKIPWKHKRLQRTFSAMLAVLLDGGVPESEAVRLAGDCTANEICRRRTARILAAMEQGVKLDDAIRAFDDRGEFRWRLSNATHTRGGFLKALHGWHETLDARAFQQEEATAQAVTSGLVIMNGLAVGLIVTAMFGLLVAILRATLSSS
jgi:type II secretory pathway component PulF